MILVMVTTQMDDVFGEVVQSMPVQLVEPVERMINRDVRYRPTMQYFTSVSLCPLCLYPSVLLSAYISPRYNMYKVTRKKTDHSVKTYSCR